MSLLQGIKGAALGGGIAALIAFSLVGLLGDLSDMERYWTHLLTSTVAGLVVGAIGGFASRLFPEGLSLLKSISIVAACAGLAHYIALSLTVPYKQLPSYLPAVSASLVGGLIVTTVGALRNRMRSPTDETGRRREDG
ncbi:MAG: hypothetical protein ABIK89_25585 [Planctomycetota bacterium]